MTQLDDIFLARDKRGSVTFLPDPPEEELPGVPSSRLTIMFWSQ